MLFQGQFTRTDLRRNYLQYFARNGGKYRREI